jgi:hypothetical protein
MSSVRVSLSKERLGVDLHMYEGAGPVASDRWSFGGWDLYFVRLDAGQRWQLDEQGSVSVKVVVGRLTTPSRVPYIAPRSLADTRVTEGELVAGPEGALVTVLVKTPSAPDRVTSMNDIALRGPHADVLGWTSFGERFAAYTDYFNGLDAGLTPGFHLLDAAGEEICYLYLWTAGKGVDLSTHNHGRAPSPTSPAFAEVHWVVSNGTGLGGMYETPEPGAPDRSRMPVPEGFEHGPFFEFDSTGAPILRENGAVTYPWHGWQGGDDGKAGQAYDVVIPFEITVPYARITAA